MTPDRAGPLFAPRRPRPPLRLLGQFAVEYSVPCDSVAAFNTDPPDLVRAADTGSLGSRFRSGVVPSRVPTYHSTEIVANHAFGIAHGPRPIDGWGAGTPTRAIGSFVTRDDFLNRGAWFTSSPPAGRSGDRHDAISGSPRGRSGRREYSSSPARAAIRRGHRARRRYFAILRGAWQPHKPSRRFEIRPHNLAAQWQQKIVKRLHSPANRWTRRAPEMERFQQLATLDHPLPTRPQGLSRRRPRVQVPSTPQDPLGEILRGFA